MTIFKCLILLFGCIVFSVDAKYVAFTFDDAPRSAKGYFDGPTRAQKLIEELKKHELSQVAFFANSKSLDGEGQARLLAYANAGHIIANHTHSHPDINKTDLNTYIREIETAHHVLKEYPNFKSWFRFPYLREGNTIIKRDGVRKYLEKMGYFNAYITLNNYDWYLENLFQQAVQNERKINFDKLKALYIDVLIQGAEYYDSLAVKHLKRAPKHVLLLHEMDLTALFVGDLADAFRKKGWRVISPVEAYQDAIANYQTNVVMKYNPGRIGELAKDNGQKKQLWHNTLNESYLKKRFMEEVIDVKQLQP